MNTKNTQPIALGEAVNNVEIKDMSPKVNTPMGEMDMPTFMEFYKKADQELNKNINIISADVIKKTTTLGREIIDKTTGVPAVDSFGAVRRYSDRYTLSLIGRGFSLEYQCDCELFNSVEEGRHYDFKGRNGDVFSFGEKKFGAIYDVAVPSFAS